MCGWLARGRKFGYNVRMKSSAIWLAAAALAPWLFLFEAFAAAKATAGAPETSLSHTGKKVSFAEQNDTFIFECFGRQNYIIKHKHYVEFWMVKKVSFQKSSILAKYM